MLSGRFCVSVVGGSEAKGHSGADTPGSGKSVTVENDGGKALAAGSRCMWIWVYTYGGKPDW